MVGLGAGPEEGPMAGAVAFTLSFPFTFIAPGEGDVAPPQGPIVGDGAFSRLSMNGAAPVGIVDDLSDEGRVT